MRHLSATKTSRNTLARPRKDDLRPLVMLIWVGCDSFCLGMAMTKNGFVRMIGLPRLY